jgi:predicted nucleic acid-binding protein
MGERRATEALADYRRLRLVRYPHEPLLPHVWALRDRLTAYDAAYVALARAMGASLLTLDRRLAEEAGRSIDVILA